ncbi:MAG: TrbC/VirB2 family protein [Erythrobacter sp.]|uniref:TrbC/VirB2 family protein n=1 Tax=Erythrobacter sp. TaxID=1042 RepID=UPI0032655D12
MIGLLTVQASLFEPSGGSPLQNAAGWMTELLQGPLVVTLCVIAVALVGFAALGGRLPVRMGARAVLGCFVLLGAPVIASALMWQGEKPVSQVVYQAPPSVAEPARTELPSADYDPYSGASLRRE